MASRPSPLLNRLGWSLKLNRRMEVPNRRLRHIFSPTVSDDIVYFGSTDNYIYAVGRLER